MRLRPASGAEYLHGCGWAGASGILQQLGTEPQSFNLMLDTLQFDFFLTDYFVDIFHACFRNRVVKIWAGVGKRIITQSGMEINRKSRRLGRAGEFEREVEEKA